MVAPVAVVLRSHDILWAIEAADRSLARWRDASGHYNNRFNSHLKGRLGEIATYRFVTQHDQRARDHFAFADREGRCDIEIADQHGATLCRLEIKTWSDEHWEALGRCVAVSQLAALRHKADRIVWCVVDRAPARTPDEWKALPQIAVRLVGWSTTAEVAAAPVRQTGHSGMRPIINHQLDSHALHPIATLLQWG